MKELFVYLCAIFVVLYIAFVAMNALKETGNISLYEGLTGSTTATTPTNASTSSTQPATITVTGVGATSQLYAQTVTTAISSLETELGMDAYSQQYLSILENLKTLYKQRALKAALQTPTTNTTDNSPNLIPLYLYGQNIQTLDLLEAFINTKKKSMW